MNPVDPRITAYVHSPFFLENLACSSDSDLTLRPLAQGEYNANYLFRHPITHKKWILRVNHGSQMHLENQIEYEFHALKVLFPSGRTPEVLFYDDSKENLPWGILVMEWLPGRPLNYKTDLTTAASILADIHSLPLQSKKKDLLIPAQNPIQSILDECQELMSHYWSWEVKNPTVSDTLKRILQEAQSALTDPLCPSCCIVNTELNSGNFLINPEGKSYLIDWEKPLLSDPAQDLGHFLAPTTTLWKTETYLTVEKCRQFLLSYRQAVGNRYELGNLEERVSQYIWLNCLRGLSWCSMAIREYSQEGRPLTNQETLKKIRQYLTPEFLEWIQQWGAQIKRSGLTR